LISVFNLSSLHLASKSILSNRCTTLFHSQLFNTYVYFHQEKKKVEQSTMKQTDKQEDTQENKTERLKILEL